MTIPSLASAPPDGLIWSQARLEALYRYGILDTDPEPQFDRIVRLAARHFGMPMALTSLIDADRQWFKARVGLQDTQTPLGNSICAVTIQQPGTLVIPDAQLDPRIRLYDAVTGEPHVRFYAGSPLITPDGHKLGTLCVLDRQPRTFTAEDEADLEDFAALVMDEFSLRRAVNELSHLALNDPLTGLPNRMHQRQHLSQAMRRAERAGERVVLALLDLNGFKGVNDTLGHAAGDALLVQVGQRLRDTLATSDLVARLGGDEFTVVLTDLRSPRGAEVAMKRVQQAFTVPFVVAGQSVDVNWSIGMAVFPDDTVEQEQLLRLADQAMYTAKRARDGRPHWNRRPTPV
ncbi:sensor domain-containing diguanylate cyclase [Deinococcus sp. QL22]|uniref:sensor domain-containing diguanylate cyclase n=1 Tax=Deinococcus sp. QL22 TaxID=2939437 RepID=UPI0020180559|nr:sensor domain-containing diguanylate cyclase [Deinococcus sp. QL22]UQN10753.1 sensor domain-containing diguanylate cyclase [Deinococcus sp. QL22]UQN10799.1 sensor domain-containing diguanylate cyclase [Deinococcus sp. QL22]